MIAPKTQNNLANAKTYFREHLRMRQYYSNGDETIGQWFGTGAEMLGLTGEVNEQDFLNLCDNIHPKTGKRLTMRLKNDSRRIFYDLTIAPPKSVSLAALVGKNSAVVEAHDKAVHSTMQEFENYAATRIRADRTSEDRFTNNIVATTFRHDTSRELDPQLHTHCLLFNATFDPVEEKWKALQNYEILKAQKFIDNVYQHILTRELKQLGYSIENNSRGSFEILGINEPLTAKFSKRHQAINDSVEKLIEERPELASANLKDMREIIAHAERPDKVKMDSSDLQQYWQDQLTQEDRSTLSRRNLISEQTPPPAPVDLTQALAWSERHLFARRSVVEEHELLRFALEKARGEDFTVEDLKKCMAFQPHYLRNHKNDPRKLTTEEALATESEMVAIARNGKWEHCQFNPNYSLDNTRLADDQKIAVSNILNSQHFVTLFRGGAGVGKSFALAEVQRALQAADYHTITLAPQRQQVIDLEKDGLENTDTVSGFLAKKELPKDSVIMLDEGGQLSARQMLALFEFVNAHDGRIICSGDTRQHGAVEASDAMRAIEKHTGIFPVSLNTIRRQDPEKADSAQERAFITEYRKAVKDASEGSTAFSFDRLDQLGTIIEVTDEDPAKLLALQYADQIEKGQTAVAISQTWDEIQRVNEAIRDELKSRQLIEPENHPITTLKPVDLTNAQKQDKRYHTEDTTIVFNRNHRGFKKGDESKLLLAGKDSLILQGDGKVGEIKFDKLDFISVLRKQEIPLSVGDTIQLKANGKTNDGKRLANGELVTVKGINKKGSITLQDGRRLSDQNRQFVRGYAITSYGSQGKTADQVFLCDSAVRAATNKQQWYVTISRARRGIAIFTRDKMALRKNIYRLGEETLALDFIPQKLTEHERIRLTPAHKLKTNRERTLKNTFLAAAQKLLHRILQKARTQTQSPLIK